MTTAGSAPMPVEITRAHDHDVKIIWQDGHESIYPARALRLACPCAGCIDEVTGARRLIPSNVPEDVKPLRIQLVGHYALTIEWSDGHTMGIYAFSTLRQQCPCVVCEQQ